MNLTVKTEKSKVTNISHRLGKWSFIFVDIIDIFLIDIK